MMTNKFRILKFIYIPLYLYKKCLRNHYIKRMFILEELFQMSL